MPRRADLGLTQGEGACHDGGVPPATPDEPRLTDPTARPAVSETSATTPAETEARLRRPQGPRDPADSWAEGEHGRFWGLNGAAGLLAHDPARGVLLQHRVGWSHHGGTWGLPGGARHMGEDAIEGALRESHEEAGVVKASLRLLATHVFDVGYWSYTSVLTEVTEPFEPVIGDAESLALAWLGFAEVEALELHPGVARMWPELRERLEHPPVLVVDVANVMGSRPDGWWKDRAGAAQRLLDELAGFAYDGSPGPLFGLGDEWRLWPRVVAVVEGQAKAATTPEPGPRASLDVVRADRDGDQAIVDTVADLFAATASPAGTRPQVTVVTSDRGLRARVEALGARTIGARSLTSASRS